MLLTYVMTVNGHKISQPNSQSNYCTTYLSVPA